MEGNKAKRSIVCSNLPETLNKREILRKHFCKFGHVESVTCSKANKYAVVHFTSAGAARLAKENGGIIDKEYPPVEIYFSAKSPTGTAKLKERKSAASRRPTPAMQFLQSKIQGYLGTGTGAPDSKVIPFEAAETAASAAKPIRLKRSFEFTSSEAKASAPRKLHSLPEQVFPLPKLTTQTDSGLESKRSLFTFKINESKERLLALPSSTGNYEDRSGEENQASNLLQPARSQPEEPSIERPISPKLDIKRLPESSELLELLSRKSVTSEDRYKILDARDKLLRSKTPKVKVRVEFAVALAGTCKDMCPEKERYMREVQRRLDTYECLAFKDSEVDHTKAIKQYSRSSADQEEPLLHELRPISTLEMTMDYLLHNIVNRSKQPNENLMEWYTFMWDRTRSIRKDITQQQLSDLKAVELMEKCARFHIHCSSRLCELDRHAFDPKLNDENLMKCLQSLEHLYTDLHAKGIKCPGEPEFRSYQILMNLNEGDILWEVQQKTQNVLRSPEVQHALKIHLAVFQKNFVAFFRLVQQSPYMTSCILHRYFFQVRSFALRRLIRAHSMPFKDTTMPISHAKTLLGFGPNENYLFINFCETHGIITNPIKNMITLNKKHLMEPDTPIINREPFLIEFKLNVPVAEAINGKPLSLNPASTYSPGSSFDDDGYLKKSDVIFAKLDMNSGNRIHDLRRSPKKPDQQTPIFSAPLSSGLETKQPISVPPLFSFQTEKGARPNLFPFGKETSEPDGRKPEFGQPTFGQIGTGSGFFSKPVPQKESNEQVLKTYNQDMCSSLVKDVYEKEVLEISKETLLQCHRIEKEKELNQAWQNAESTTVDFIFQQLKNQSINELLQQIASDEVKKFSASKTASADLHKELQNLVVNEIVLEVCRDSIREAVQERENNIRQGVKILNKVQLSIWLQRWKRKAAEKRSERHRIIQKRKSDMENFPPSVCCSLSPASILSSWCELTVPTNVNKTAIESSYLDVIGRKKKKPFIEFSSSLTTPCHTFMDSEISVVRRKRSRDAAEIENANNTIKNSKQRSVSLSAEINDFRENNIRQGVKILNRVQLSIWLQRWKRKAAEKRRERDRIIQKRKNDMENFPPSVCCSLSPASILSSWCEITMPTNVNKTAIESSYLDVIGRKTTPCHTFLDSEEFNVVRRKRSLVAAEIESGNNTVKNSKQRSASLLAEINDFIEDLRKEKESYLLHDASAVQ